jgi:glutamate synthase (NADPH/NADH) small chain
VVGSGPAGLAAAAQLNKAGHTVTVFERDDKPGGLLRYGIPDFKLEKWVIDRRVNLMKDDGISFVCQTDVGKDLGINDLLRDYQAIVLACGSTIPRDLNVPGRNARGVYFAMQFLKQQNARVAEPGADLLQKRSFAGSSWQEEISAAGKHVVVIGGGDTGSDCVGTSNRQGAASVTQFELLPKPPEKRNANMPWPLYPMLLKTTSSHEEGCEREWAVQTKAFLTDDNGQLKALRIVNLQWTTNADGNGASFTEIPGTERDIPCDLVLLAMGFLHPQHEGLVTELDIELDARGNIKASEEYYQTTLPKVFACGDMRRGQSLVVWAISEGRECARKVDEYLQGSSLLERKESAVFADIL